MIILDGGLKLLKVKLENQIFGELEILVIFGQLHNVEKCGKYNQIMIAHAGEVYRK